MLMQLVRFGAVGIVGVITNLAVLAIVVKLMSLNANLGATTAFLVAGTQNSTFNQLWIFRSTGQPPIEYAPGWTRYLVGNLHQPAGPQRHDRVCRDCQQRSGPGSRILSGMAFNIVLSRLLIFRRDAGPSSR